MKPPTFRESDTCEGCTQCKCTHSCGCCPSEYKCIKHDYDLGSYPDQYICDDYIKDNT